MEKSKRVILNIAAGKINSVSMDEQTFLVNVDTMYHTKTSISNIEECFDIWEKDYLQPSERYFINEDIFRFLTECRIIFDEVKCYRFLEHVSRDKILYFIYLLSTSIKHGGIVDIIVPNYRELARRILHEDPFSRDFEKENIITSTELLNEKEDPHTSIWTSTRAKYYFELEERFKIMGLKGDKTRTYRF